MTNLIVSRCFANNAPDYFIVTTKQWKGEVKAVCDNEKDAKLFAAAPKMLHVIKSFLELDETRIKQLNSTEWGKACLESAKQILEDIK